MNISRMKIARFLPFTLGPAVASMVATLALFASAHAELVFKDDSGQEIRLKAPAKRIVTLAPHATEILYQPVPAIGWSGQSTTATIRRPQKGARVGSYDRIDLEAVAALKPDLVIAWETRQPCGQVEKLKALGLTVYSSQPNHMEDVAGTTRTLRANWPVPRPSPTPAAERFRQRLAALRDGNAGKPPVRVFYQIWKAPLMTVGGPQIISDAIRLCGGENVFGKLDQMSPTVSVEAVLAANPEVIVATGMGDARPEWLDDWNKWTRMTAVSRGNLFHINPDIMQRHTPRILDGASQLCADLDIARSRRPPGERPK